MRAKFRHQRPKLLGKPDSVGIDRGALSEYADDRQLAQHCEHQLTNIAPPITSRRWPTAAACLTPRRHRI